MSWIIIIIIIVLLLLLTNDKENFSMGALTQLYSKGPQDTYLTGDAWKYFPYWWDNYWGSPYYIPNRTFYDDYFYF